MWEALVAVTPGRTQRGNPGVFRRLRDPSQRKRPERVIFREELRKGPTGKIQGCAGRGRSAEVNLPWHLNDHVFAKINATIDYR